MIDIYLRFLIDRTSETAVADLKRSEMELSEQVETANVRVNEINDELASIMEQLGEAKVDKHESSRAIKKKELLENLRRLFPGVVSVLSGGGGAAVKDKKFDFLNFLFTFKQKRSLL